MTQISKTSKFTPIKSLDAAVCDAKHQRFFTRITQADQTTQLHTLILVFASLSAHVVLFIFLGVRLKFIGLVTRSIYSFELEMVSHGLAIILTKINKLPSKNN